WMPDDNRFARNDHRLLRRFQFSNCPHCAVLRTTHGKGLRWGSRACSVLLADAGHNLFARTMISEKPPNAKRQIPSKTIKPQLQKWKTARNRETLRIGRFDL